MFNWDDLDLNITKTKKCGRRTCLFVDKVNPNITYLIKTEIKDIDILSRFDATLPLTIQTKDFDQAKRLKQEYNIRHFLGWTSIYR